MSAHLRERERTSDLQGETEHCGVWLREESVSVRREWGALLKSADKRGHW